MNNREKENVKPPETVLREGGFAVSQKCCSRPSCFDFAARKSDDLVFIKVESDIDTFSPCDASELKAISKCVPSTLLLIAEKTRERPLEDDTVYSRYDILAVTPKTFENIVIRKINPLIQAGPGGYYVEIDCEAIKRRRQKLGFSVGEMAEIIGISRRTLYGYERGMGKASVTAAYNMIYALGVPVAKPVNVFEKAKDQHKCFFIKAKHAIARHRLLQRILKRLKHCPVTTVRKAPFDFVINLPEEKTKIIGGVASDRERELSRRISEILSVSKIIEAHPIFITEGQKPLNEDILYITSEEFSKIKDYEDLICRF